MNIDIITMKIGTHQSQQPNRMLSRIFEEVRKRAVKKGTQSNQVEWCPGILEAWGSEKTDNEWPNKLTHERNG